MSNRSKRPAAGPQVAWTVSTRAPSGPRSSAAEAAPRARGAALPRRSGPSHRPHSRPTRSGRGPWRSRERSTDSRRPGPGRGRLRRAGPGSRPRARSRDEDGPRPREDEHVQGELRAGIPLDRPTRPIEAAEETGQGSGLQPASRPADLLEQRRVVEPAHVAELGPPEIQRAITPDVDKQHRGAAALSRTRLLRRCRLIDLAGRFVPLLVVGGRAERRCRGGRPHRGRGPPPAAAAGRRPRRPGGGLRCASSAAAPASRGPRGAAGGASSFFTATSRAAGRASRRSSSVRSSSARAAPASAERA